MSPTPSSCSSCGAPIEWAVTEHGKRIPLDLEPTPTGNLVVVDGIARTLKPTGEGWTLRVSHFATCPNAGVHRRRRSRA